MCRFRSTHESEENSSTKLPLFGYSLVYQDYGKESLTANVSQNFFGKSRITGEANFKSVLPGNPEEMAVTMLKQPHIYSVQIFKAV